jgi:murein DD-endopeptidase MepM/ murein hydrolase activator NlpD
MSEAPLRPVSAALRVGLLVSVAALVAGCASDTQRFAPTPWSSAQQQNADHFGRRGSTPAGETTGSIQPRGPSVQSQPLAPVASNGPSAWTPPPPRQPPAMQFQRGPAPVATPAPRPQPAADVARAPSSGAPRAGRLAWDEPAVAARTHTVAPGESVVSIARRYGVGAADLARANQLGPADRLRIGQVVAVPPAGGAQIAAPARREADPVQTASTRPTDQPRPSTPPPAQREQPPAQASAPPASPQQAAAQAQPPRAAAQPPAPAAQPQPQAAAAEPARSSTEFRWPVRGRVVTNFGRQPGGGQSDGIGIAVPVGTPVKAAENGVVAYAGSELRGYGNLILVRHEGDWVTAYAHNSEVLVRRGEQVRRGQTIARAGQSGAVAQPMVHFEIRRGSNPVNPIDHLTGG